MKHRFYKPIITLMTICFIANMYGQKYDKKFTESFKTNKDVEVVINATNTDIKVTNWNKNEVAITAYIEVEGLSKKEAEKYFKNWNFEALGNKKKVQITSKGNNKFKDDFVFFDDMNFDFQLPEIDMSNLDIVVLPEMDFDFDFDFDPDKIIEDLGDLEENIGKNGKYSFMWKDDDHDIEIKSKKEWEAFKKTKDYKELKKKMKIDKEKMRKEFAKSKELMKKKLKESKSKMIINKEKVRKQLEKAKEHLKKLKFDFYSDKNDFKINGKKVKIKKRLEIKVPKGATFNLNTRHCKVKLPNTVAFGNVKYGTFDANNLLGGKLTINYSPVKINDLDASTLFLNNVTDAKIASVTNTTMNNNSSEVNIAKINENVIISDKFGKLTIQSIISAYKNFSLNLDNSDATLDLSNLKNTLKFYSTSMETPVNISANKKSTIFNGFITANNDDKTIYIEGKNSKLTIIK